MKSINEQYNELIYFLIKLNVGDEINPKEVGITKSDLLDLLDAMENDRLIKKTKRFISNDNPEFRGLTFQGRNFVENQDKKQYSKIEKTEIYNHYNVNVGGDNNGQIAIGNDNNFVSEFDEKFTALIQAMLSSQLADKDLIIEELKRIKSDKVELQSFLVNLLTRGAEVASIVPFIAGLLGLK
jgi:hypothetical protein